MKPSVKFQVLFCLVLYTSCVQAIMVKFGTKGGPIEPPTPEPQPPMPRSYRAPAPVWEERTNDAPDPNAHWRPFIPQEKYTQIFINSPITTPPPQNNAQRFVNSYKPVYQPALQPAFQAANPQNKFFHPGQVLSSQSLPGIGLRYFVPFNNVVEQNKIYKQEDAKHNQVETNHIDSAKESSSDLLWKYEKDAVQRNLRHTLEATAPVYQWQWPAYVQPRH
ncbi:uncharacterized protein LOC119831569 [Zerene cesonia]|uniref:uncharacterized protein LOC119831569 n=1 Tax=Zerene cesonia TaxID=33412 RepID=UPI0018E536BD|nr:uncharacterized protein LOC119831569 [Zerene cesonia]